MDARQGRTDEDTLNNDGSITVRNQFQVSKNRSEATFGQ